MNGDLRAAVRQKAEAEAEGFGAGFIDEEAVTGAAGDAFGDGSGGHRLGEDELDGGFIVLVLADGGALDLRKADEGALELHQALEAGDGGDRDVDALAARCECALELGELGGWVRGTGDWGLGAGFGGHGDGLGELSHAFGELLGVFNESAA